MIGSPDRSPATVATWFVVLALRGFVFWRLARTLLRCFGAGWVVVRLMLWRYGGACSGETVRGRGGVVHTLVMKWITGSRSAFGANWQNTQSEISSTGSGMRPRWGSAARCCALTRSHPGNFRDVTTIYCASCTIYPLRIVSIPSPGGVSEMPQTSHVNVEMCGFLAQILAFMASPTLPVLVRHLQKSSHHS